MCNITLLTSSDYPCGGAPENFVREMVKGIVNVEGVNINIIRFWGNRNNCNNDSGVTCTNFLFTKPISNELLKFFELILQVLNIPIFILKLKFIYKTNILLLYGIDRAYIGGPSLLLCKIFRIKCYRIITEIYKEEDYAYKWWRKPLIFFNSMQSKYFDRYLDGIIVLSHYLREYCIANGVKEKNILLIHHFIDFNRNPNYCIDNGNDCFNIVYSGTLTLENGIVDLVNAFLLFKEKTDVKSSLVIMGAKNRNIYSESEENHLKKYNIEFTGNLDREDIFSIMSHASVLVNPRRKSVLADSGFPTKIGEYFSTKRPVLSTSVGDLSRYFTNRKELYLSPPDNPAEFAKMMQYIHYNQKESILVGYNGYNWGKRHLDNLENSRRLIDFFECFF